MSRSTLPVVLSWVVATGVASATEMSGPAAPPRTVAPVAPAQTAANSPSAPPRTVAPGTPAQAVTRNAASPDMAAYQQLSDRIGALELHMKNQGVLALFNQLAELKADLARLRGQQEELLHAQQLAEKRVKDLYADLDGRMKALAKATAAPPTGASAAPRGDAAPSSPQVTKPAAKPAPPPPPQNDAEMEGKAYEAALGLLKEGNYAPAAKAFQDFLHAYPNAALAPNGLYWLGLAQFSQGEFKSAIATQQRLLSDFPSSAKVPDAMINLARSHLQLDETDASRAWLERVIAEHPASKAADTARKMQELTK